MTQEVGGDGGADWPKSANNIGQGAPTVALAAMGHIDCTRGFRLVVSSRVQQAPFHQEMLLRETQNWFSCYGFATPTPRETPSD